MNEVELSSVGTLYVLDTNVFITAYQRYYGLDFARPFWDFLVQAAQTGHLLSIDKVKEEIVGGGDDLATWFTENFQDYCISTRTADVLNAYQMLVQHVQNNIIYHQRAKNEFMDIGNADAWLLAYCWDVHQKGTEVCLVTLEMSNANARKRIPIPNICQDFGLDYCNSFDLIRALKFSF